jgi:hypothetical protein
VDVQLADQPRWVGTERMSVAKEELLTIAAALDTER